MVFAGASWQRCRTHFMTNVLSRVPKRAQPAVATMVRTIDQQPSPEEVDAQHRRAVGADLRRPFDYAQGRLRGEPRRVAALAAAGGRPRRTV